MAALSVMREGGPAVGVADPIFFIPEPEEWSEGTELVFEMFQRDAGALRDLVGKREYYVIGPTRAFWGVLKSLDPMAATHPTLMEMPYRPTMRGVLVIYGERPGKQ